MKSFLCTLFLLTASFFVAEAQVTLSRSVLGTTGSNNEQLSYTVGETVIETASSASIILTQGFQQPDQITGTAIDPQRGNIAFLVYPNPTQAELVLELTAEQRSVLQVGFVDVKGKIVMSGPRLTADPQVQSTFDVSHFAAGTYMLTLTNEQGQLMQTIRFIKTD